MTDDYRRARERYRAFKRQTRELIEEEAVSALRPLRLHAVSIDDDILRRVAREWYGRESRLVGWDWDSEIVDPLHRFGPRTFDAAFIVDGQLCALMAARVSPHKRWLSLTHLEGSAEHHPLKGSVVPLAIRSLYIYRAVISEHGEAENIGIRLLRPLESALDCYRRHGFDKIIAAKKDSAIIVEPMTGRAQ